MHEWLTVIIVLIIIGVLLDGIRRMRQARRNALQMTLDVHREALHEDGIQAYGSDSTVSKPSSIQRRVVNLEESVPMLMDSVASINSKDATNDPDRPYEQENDSNIHGDNSQIIQPEIAETETVAHDLQEKLSEPTLGIGGIDADADYNLGKSLNKRVEPKLEQAPDIGETLVEEPQSPTKKPPPRKLHKQLEEVLILHIEATDGEYFQGRALLKLMLDQGFRYGAMNIFHRHVNEEGEGAVLFSIANMVMPGTFTLATFEELLTPGVSIFMSLPMVDYNGMDAFERMLTTAKTIASGLSGNVNDDQHSAMTRQTIEHYRERIRNFSRKQQLLEST